MNRNRQVHVGHLKGCKGSMTDIQAHLDKIRSDAAECILLSSLATDGKREVFARTAEHLNALASEIEKTIATNTADKGTPGESVHVARPADHEETVAPDIAVAHQLPAARPRRILPWLVIVILAGIGAAFFWANKPVKEYWSLLSTLQSKRETSPTPPDETKQAIAALLSSEQAERKIVMEQLGALAARVDSLVTALDNLKTSRGEIAGPSNKVGAEEKPPAAETKPSAPEEKPVRGEENRTPTLESPAAAKRSDGTPSATDSPEPVDRVGAIAVRTRRAETIGPPGCTQFRSFDPVSGTYTSFEGRRRPCRQ
jgi:hypothetical protein